MWIAGIFMAALLGGCAAGTSSNVAAAAPQRAATDAGEGAVDDAAAKLPSSTDEREATILVSTSDEMFCDGARMDSAGYRATLTKEKRVKLPPHGATLASRAKAVAMAAGERCRDALRDLDFEVHDGVVRVPPIPGWAGIGIAMCTCKPEVEVNLLRMPGVAKVEWSGPF